MARAVLDEPTYYCIISWLCLLFLATLGHSWPSLVFEAAIHLDGTHMGIGKWLALDELAGIDAPSSGRSVKDCEGKSMPEAGRYIRTASRTSADNTKLVAGLRSILAIENETVSTTEAYEQNNLCQP